MPNVELTTIPVSGSASEQTIAVHDNKRRYLAIVATSGTCYISYGEADHSLTKFQVAQGNMLEIAVNCISAMKYSGAGTTLSIIQDLDSKIALTSDGKILTYDGEVMTYKQNDFALSAPMFS